jgi:hypothetical protein
MPTHVLERSWIRWPGPASSAWALMKHAAHVGTLCVAHSSVRHLSSASRVESLPSSKHLVHCGFPNSAGNNSTRLLGCDDPGM